MSAVAEEVGRFFGRRIAVQPGRAPQRATPRRCPDIAKMEKLGYRPKISLAEGLPRLAKWYVENASAAPKPCL